MNTNQIVEAINWVTRDTPIMFDVTVTTPPDDLIRQRAQDNYNRGKPDSLDKDFYLSDTCKSIIVWNVFSDVAYDYFYKNNFLPKIITYLNLRYEYNFGYDGYNLNRKQFAIRSGAATLAKTSLAFHKKFGMNYKIDLIFTNAEFDDAVVVEGQPHYENCEGCDAPCERLCPVGCTMNFDLVNWEKCSNFVDTPEAFKNLDTICRICQEKCPYSEDLRKEILSIDVNYGGRINA